MFVVEVKAEMCSAPHQLYGWPTHIYALATLHSDAENLLMSKRAFL